ncbi:MAG: terminase gpA endonuclease subunit [Candidatus Hodarchaeales archaeon]|jgi:phage terminase large subunit GpA-like protein
MVLAQEITRGFYRFDPTEERIRSPEVRKTFFEWMETEYFLSPKVHGLSTRWSSDYGPFWVDIIKALDDTTTREVWAAAPAQSGKSTIMTGWLGYTCAVDPVPMGLVMPRDTDASERVETNIIPMFEMNADLLQHVGGSIRRINVGKMTMFDRMAFYLLYASSAAAMAGKSICRIGLDEVGKFPARVGREADPISLARDRLETFKGRSKLFATTTPVLVNDTFDIEFKKGDRCQWQAVCVHCDEPHVMSWHNVQLDKTDAGELLDPEEYVDGERARYVCPNCGALWTETDRWSSVCAGSWAPTEAAAGSREIRSFHIAGWMLHPAIQTIGYLASKWAAAIVAKKAGDLGPLQGVINSRFAEPWEMEESRPDEARLRRHITGHKQLTVPVGGKIITAAVDVQLDHLWFASVAWGYQFQGWLLDARRIETGSTEKVENFEHVKPYLMSRYDKADDPDNVIRIARAGIDAGFRTDQVYTVCRSWADLPVNPLMGWQEDRLGGLYRARKLGDGLVRYDLNVDKFKDSIYRQLFIAEQAGAGFLHLYAGIETGLLRHLISEHLVRRIRGRREVLTWELRSQRWPNHLWDLLVYCRFLAELAGVPALPDPTKKVAPQYYGRPVKKKPIRTKY